MSWSVVVRLAPSALCAACLAGGCGSSDDGVLRGGESSGGSAGGARAVDPGRGGAEMVASSGGGPVDVEPPPPDPSCAAGDSSACRAVQNTQQCCTSEGQCGAIISLPMGGAFPCTELDAPGDPDPQCADVAVPGGVLVGCCTPLGECGAIFPEFGCQIDVLSGNAPPRCDAVVQPPPPADGGLPPPPPPPPPTGGGLVPPECVDCLNAQCPTEAAACAANANCVAARDCFFSCSVFDCLNCLQNAQANPDNGEFGLLTNCTQTVCASVCPQFNTGN